MADLEINATEMGAVETMEPEQLEIEEILPQKPVIKIIVWSDKLRADIRLERESEETLNPEREDIEAELAAMGIVYGIDDQCIARLCANPVYDEGFEIAKGKTAQTGKNGYLTYLVETKREMRPKLRPDGTVDYRDLGFVHNVMAEQPLCEVHRAEKGEDGSTIFGVVLEGSYGREPNVPAGKNTVYDEENEVVRAVVNGNVNVDSHGIINVQDILQISGNVDNSTGDIHFISDVIINGDVMSGFKVDSQQGSIIVKGAIEGAKLSAAGDIIAGEGINGMNSAKIEAGGNIRCKFIQNAVLSAGGDIFTDFIMHCMIECNGNVELSGKSGALIGGKMLVAKTLIAKTIGTSSHVATHVTMAGGGLDYNKKLVIIKKEISALDDELKSIIQTLTWCADLIKKGTLKPFQLNAFEHAKVRYMEIPNIRAEKNSELERIQEELNNIKPEETYIKCSNRIHSGVRIMFGKEIMNVQASFVNSKVWMMDGEISVSPQ